MYPCFAIPIIIKNNNNNDNNKNAFCRSSYRIAPVATRFAGPQQVGIKSRSTSFEHQHLQPMSPQCTCANITSHHITSAVNYLPVPTWASFRVGSCANKDTREGQAACLLHVVDFCIMHPDAYSELVPHKHTSERRHKQALVGFAFCQLLVCEDFELIALECEVPVAQSITNIRKRRRKMIDYGYLFTPMHWHWHRHRRKGGRESRKQKQQPFQAKQSTSKQHVRDFEFMHSWASNDVHILGPDPRDWGVHLVVQHFCDDLIRRNVFQHGGFVAHELHVGENQDVVALHSCEECL